MTLLASIDAGSDADSVLYPSRQVYTSGLSVNASSIPTNCARMVLSGARGDPTYRYAQGHGRDRRGRARSAPVDAYYFEVFDLSDLDHTLRVLGLTCSVPAL